MRLLYLTDGRPDYLSDDLLYGLRSVLGAEVVDFPRKDVLYANSALRPQAAKLYGAGFHCFGLDDIAIDRDDLGAKLRNGYFDAVVNSSAWRIACPTHPRLVVVDGEDHPNLSARYLRKVPLYFKRELEDQRSDVEPILFALPDFLYDASELARTQRVHASFRAATSGIRGELASLYPPRLGFTSWRDYQDDIKRSWFAISPRGAGYDCQRHYEILGRSVLCLYLDDGAPWLLRQSFRDGENCLSFRTAAELLGKIDSCREPQALIERGRQDLETTHLASRRATQFLQRIATIATSGAPLSMIERQTWRYWLAWQSRRNARFDLGR